MGGRQKTLSANLAQKVDLAKLAKTEIPSAERADWTARRAEIVRQKSELAKSAKTDVPSAERANKGQTDFVKETAIRQVGERPKDSGQTSFATGAGVVGPHTGASWPGPGGSATPGSGSFSFRKEDKK